MEILVQTYNLTKQYGQHKAVSNVNLSVKKGEIYGLIGKNGAGKTTVLRLISRLAKPTEGDISLFGQNSHDTCYSQNRVGILIENPGVYPNMSAKDNVKLKCLAMGISSKSYISELLEEVGLSANDKKKVKHFSVGMKQRLGIALALVGNPELVLLDEPINGLDPQGMVEIRAMVTRLNKEKGITFIISSHILGELSKIATSYGIIDKGELKKQILKTELTEDLEEYYLSLTGGIYLMTKMIKMDLYRFFRSASTWIILFAAAVLAFLSVMLVHSSTSIQPYSNAGELLAAQINGGMRVCE